MKVVTIIGNRPQFIKAAPVARRLRKVAREILVHTGQHYDENMSDVFFQELDIPKPDYNLGVGSGPHGFQTGEILKGVEEILLAEQPDAVVVYGDTNSTLAGALAAAKLHIPIAHVEAGLRSFNRLMPEEINRVVTDHLSSLLFAPTDAALRNLKREGISDGVFQVGDVMFDAALQHLEVAQKRSRILHRLRIEPKAYILATVHRAENTDDRERLQGILTAMECLAREITVVFPVHPRTRKAMHDLDYRKTNSLILTEPVSYLDMLLLESEARAIMTDSGGVQKEAFFLRVPCVTLRNETEWVETVESGWNVLVGAQPERILKALREAKPGASDVHPYGNGDASEKLVEVLVHELVKREALPRA